MLHGRFQDEIGTNLGFSRKRTFLERLSRAPLSRRPSRPLVAPLVPLSLVAEHDHLGPAKPSGGLVQRL